MQTNSMRMVTNILWDNMDEDDLNSFHDVILEATDKSLTKEQLKQILLSLPKDIILSAMEWRISDTVVRDDIYTFVKSQSESEKI